MLIRKLTLLSVVVSFLVSGCGSIVAPIVPTETLQPESIATDTVPEDTNTLATPLATGTRIEEPVIETPIPTKSLPSSLTPTPTEILPVEWDVDPYIIRDIEGEYRGVTIKASFIVDGSLEDIVENVEIDDNLYAEMIVKILAKVWYAREKTEPWELAKPIELNKWVDLWAKAQETGSEYYWSQVRLNRIWANDLNDGNGYVKKSYNFQPMYEGVSPSGITGIDKITFVVFDVNKTDILNVDNLSLGATTRLVAGSNIDNQNLYIYIGRDTYYYAASIMEGSKYDYNPYPQPSATRFALQLNLYIFPDYLIYNDKGDIDFPSIGPGLSLNQLMNVAVKYKLRGE